MRNFAPQQQEAMGQATQQLGELGMTIGARMQDVMDDAKTKAAETQFLQAATDITTNYRALKNEDAINGYSTAAAGLANAQAKAESGLTNNLQRQMFNQVALRHQLDFGAQLSNHRNDQTLNFGINEANTRADNYVQLAANGYHDWQNSDGEYATNRARAIKEAQGAAQLAGLSLDSAQAQAMVKQKTTQLVQGVLTRMMDHEQYPEARVYYDKALAAGDIDERVAEQLGNSVMESHNLNKGKNIAASAVQLGLGALTPDPPYVQPIRIGSIASSAGPTHVGGNAQSGIDISVPVGTEVHAPTSGVVTKVVNDGTPGGGVTMQVTYANGSVATFAGLSSASYREGQSVTQDAVLGSTGKASDGSSAGLHWSMTDKDGNAVDPRSVSPAPKDTADFTTPEALKKALDWVDASSETERVKDIARNSIRSQYGLATDMAKQKYLEVWQSAADYYVSHHNSIDGLPSELQMQLKPEDLSKLSHNPERTTNLNTWYNLVMNPGSLTPDSVTTAYAHGQLNQADRDALTARAKAQQGNSAAATNAADTIELVKFYAQQGGIEAYGQQSDADKFRLGTLTYRVLQQVDQIKANNNGKATPDQVDSIIKDELTRQTLAELRSPQNVQGSAASLPVRPGQRQVEHWEKSNGTYVRIR